MIRRRPRLPADAPPPQAPARPELTVAVILDEFSGLAFGYEWNQIDVRPRRLAGGVRARAAPTCCSSSRPGTATTAAGGCT